MKKRESILNEIKLALIGKNIAHSKSQEMYEKLLNCKISYTLEDHLNPKKIPSLEDLKKKYMGVSITSPYKGHFLDKVNILGEWKKSINTLIFNDRTIDAISTDYLACNDILKSLIIKNKVSRIITLGDGHMAQMIEEIIKRYSLKIIKLSRSLGTLTPEMIDKSISDESTLVINCCARDYVYKNTSKIAYLFWDMNYGISEHENLSLIPGIKYENGLELLNLQAKYALSFWKLKQF